MGTRYAAPYGPPFSGLCAVPLRSWGLLTYPGTRHLSRDFLLLNGACDPLAGVDDRDVGTSEGAEGVSALKSGGCVGAAGAQENARGCLKTGATGAEEGPAAVTLDALFCACVCISSPEPAG